MRQSCSLQSIDPRSRRVEGRGFGLSPSKRTATRPPRSPSSIISSRKKMKEVRCSGGITVSRLCKSLDPGRRPTRQAAAPASSTMRPQFKEPLFSFGPLLFFSFFFFFSLNEARELAPTTLGPTRNANVQKTGLTSSLPCTIEQNGKTDTDQCLL